MRTLAAVVVFVSLAPFSAAMDFVSDGERQAKVAEIRARFDVAMERNAHALVNATADPAERADVALAIGAIYELGLMSDPDPVKAASFFGIASDLNCAEANCALGNIYSRGVESKSGRIGRDVAMAVEYYGRAAVGGSVKAMLELGGLYNAGTREVPRDAKKALAYFMDAASRGSQEALDLLEPVMRQAREWEGRHPGRKANFPTSREKLVKPELERADRQRAARLDKTASHVYVELNTRIAKDARLD